jgi:hypothetical protein
MVIEQYLAMAVALRMQDPDVLDLVRRVRYGPAHLSAGGSGDRPGVRGALGAEGAFHLGEQRQQAEVDAGHAFVGAASRARPAQVRPRWLAARPPGLDQRLEYGCSLPAAALQLSHRKQVVQSAAQIGWHRTSTPPPSDTRPWLLPIRPPSAVVGAGEVVPRRQRVAAVCAGGTATHGVMALRLFDESVSATRTEPQR